MRHVRQRSDFAVNCLASFWHWYTTVDATGDIARLQETALFAIAGVAAVLWTGGLIAFQLKQWTISRGVGLDLASNAFMASLFALFMRPLTLRYAATLFFFIFLRQCAWVLYAARPSNVEQQKAKREKARPDLDKLPVERWRLILASNRRWALIELAMLAPYLVVVAMPFQTVVVWFAALYTFLSYQVILLTLNGAPDAVNQWTLRSDATTFGLLGIIAQKLDALANKP